MVIFFHGGGWTNGYKEWCGFMAPALAARTARGGGTRRQPRGAYLHVALQGLQNGSGHANELFERSQLSGLRSPVMRSLQMASCRGTLSSGDSEV